VSSKLDWSTVRERLKRPPRAREIRAALEPLIETVLRSFLTGEWLRPALWGVIVCALAVLIIVLAGALIRR
jgi:hypothetical protein